MIVRNYGMRIQLGEVKAYPTNPPVHAADRMPVYAADGAVLNMDEVREAGVVPMSWLRDERYDVDSQTTVRPGCWRDDHLVGYC